MIEENITKVQRILNKDDNQLFANSKDAQDANFLNSNFNFSILIHLSSHKANRIDILFNFLALS